MAQPFSSDPAQQVLSVAELTGQIKHRLEGAFSAVAVSGEISNFSRPQSGHCYFTLKDQRAQLRAVLWRGQASRIKFPLEDGLEVVCHGHLDVYAPRGSYQLVVERIEPQGIGALELALRRLREKLAAEGLFDAERKRPLPKFPRRIGFVTSPTGAAVRDFLEVLRRRWQGVHVLVLPARVQGQAAAAELVAGVELAERLRPALDVLVVGRGGGSLEDLWCFNDETLVRAIAASPIPVVSAVGHEIDVTLSDLAADVRALTPSEAAERVVPAAEEVMAQPDAQRRRLTGSMRARLATVRARLEAAANSPALRRPLDRIHEQERRLDELAARRDRAIAQTLETSHQRFNRLAGKLEALSPLEVLARGYSVTSRVHDGKLIRQANDLQPGEVIENRLAKGRVISTVESVQPSPLDF